MAYTKNIWVDQAGQVRYQESVDQDNLLILTPNYEQVTQLGTPVNSTNMNHIEDGIAGCYNDLVNKSGDTMTGQLKVKKSGLGINYCGSDIDFTTAPSSNITVPAYRISDKNENRMGSIEYIHRADGSHGVNISDKKDNDTGTYANLFIGWDVNGNAYTVAPIPAASSNTNNIAPTQWVKNFAKTSGSNYMSTFSQGAAGYYKFTNGLIIQWGTRDAMPTNGTLAITFPTAFSNTNYSFTDCAIKTSTTGDIRSSAIIKKDSKSTTGLTIMQDTYADDGGQWIAIGY